MANPILLERKSLTLTTSPTATLCYCSPECPHLFFNYGLCTVALIKYASRLYASSPLGNISPKTFFLAFPMEHEYRAPIFVEDGDPLADDDRLLHGPSLADDLTNEVGHVLMKSSSEQQLARRWGKQEPGTGKSKTSLVITVPPRHITGAPASGTMSGPRFIENGITYQYTSSSSGGNRTASSFGVIGEPFSFRQNETGGHTDSRRQPLFGNQDPRPPNSLRDLVDQSVVFEPAYLQLYQEGETGPGARPRTPGLLTQQEQASLMPKRRRSYSDVGHKRLKICAGGDERVTRGLIATASLFAMDSHEAPAEYIEPEGEVFTREGASFYQARHLEVHPDLDQRHDPLTLTWPKGVSHGHCPHYLSLTYPSPFS